MIRLVDESLLNVVILKQAESYVPKSGYDTAKYYVVPTNKDGTPANPKGKSADDSNAKASSTKTGADETLITPRGSGWTGGYLTGDGLAPNGFPVTPAIQFPTDPREGAYVLRLDYMPNRLFRYDGVRWVKVEDAVRTKLDGTGDSQRDSFINYKGTYADNKGKSQSGRTGLSKALEPEED